MALKLQQGQVWQVGREFLRIVQLERMSVGYKLIKDPDSREGTHQNATKKEFCRLIKGGKGKLLGTGKLALSLIDSSFAARPHPASAAAPSATDATDSADPDTSPAGQVDAAAAVVIAPAAADSVAAPAPVPAAAEKNGAADPATAGPDAVVPGGA